MSDQEDQLAKDIETVTAAMKAANVFSAVTLTRQNILTIRYVLKVHLGKSLTAELQYANKQGAKYDLYEALDYVTDAVDAYHVLDNPLMVAESSMTSHYVDVCTVNLPAANVASIIKRLQSPLPGIEAVQAEPNVSDFLKEEFQLIYNDVPNVIELLKAANEKALSILKNDPSPTTQVTDESSTSFADKDYSKLLKSLKKGGALN